VPLADLFKILLSVPAQLYDTMPCAASGDGGHEASRSAGVRSFIIATSHCFRLRGLDRVDSRRMGSSFGVGEVCQAV
jgi:hypothetical protein